MQLFRNLGKLFAFILRHARGVRHARAMLVLVIAAGVANGLGNAVLIGIVNRVVNGSGSSVARMGWLFAAVCVAMPVARYVSEFLLVYLSERSTFELRMSLSRHVLGAPLRRIEEIGAPKLMAVLTGDVPNVVGTLVVLPLLCMNLAVVGGSLVYMGILSWKLLTAVLVFLVAGVLAYQLPLLKAQSYVMQTREGMDELFRHFKGLTDGIKELKLHHARRQAFLSEELERTVGQLRTSNVAAQRLFTASVSWGQALVFVLVGLLTFWVPHLTPVTAQVLTGFVIAILYMVTPIQVVMNSVPQLARAVVAIDRVEKLGLELSGAGRENAPMQLPARAGRGWQSLELRGVTHAYHSEREQTTFTLGPLDLSFEPGQIVFLTGGNGSGKTTLAKLLTGLYSPESGAVLLDGRPVGRAEAERYFGLFSVVFSDFYLFDRLLGIETHALDEQAKRYLEELHLDHKVTVEDGKLSTTELSQGQRKRLALLTAYLEDRDIYLFDEWAADQDPVFKDVFYRQLLPQLKERGKTVIAISHDDRYYPMADRVIKLEYGQVVEDTAAELLSAAV
jgi:putative ATP-binding cassette transporter